MTFLQLPLAYLLWHYTTAWADLWRIYTNVIWFLSNLFSIRLLSGTLFSPWKRLHEDKGVKAAGGMFGKLIINAVSRLVGCIARIGVISAGVLTLFVCFLVFLVVFMLWIIVPLAVPLLILVGLTRLSTLL